MSSESVGVHLLLSGRVQGVGFRYYAARAARELGVTGWVRNRDDGKVEIEAAGAPDRVREFAARIRQGPGGARVAEVRELPLDRVPDREGFEIVY